MKLSQARIHDRVCIQSFSLDIDTDRRLQALGMLPGTTIEILHRRRSGTMIILLRGSRFALGRKMTQEIEVEPVLDSSGLSNPIESKNSGASGKELSDSELS